MCVCACILQQYVNMCVRDVTQHTHTDTHAPTKGLHSSRECANVGRKSRHTHGHAHNTPNPRPPHTACVLYLHGYFYWAIKRTSKTTNDNDDDAMRCDAIDASGILHVPASIATATAGALNCKVNKIRRDGPIALTHIYYIATPPPPMLLRGMVAWSHKIVHRRSCHFKRFSSSQQTLANIRQCSHFVSLARANMMKRLRPQWFYVLCTAREQPSKR